MLTSNSEMIDVIDGDDQTIGRMERSSAYALKQSHRIVHVMVESQQQLLIVRRALGVRYLPGYFCTSAGGHVVAGESFLQAAQRELSEEIGLTGDVEHIETFSFHHEFRVSVALFLFRLKTVSQLHFNSREVLDGRFYAPADWRALDQALFHPQLKTCLEKTWSYLNA